MNIVEEIMGKSPGKWWAEQDPSLGSILLFHIHFSFDRIQNTAYWPM